jgi:ferric-dicitrate binding protein FerR (iron transport regulator)
MDCQQTLDKIGRLVDGELPASDRASLEAHLAECDGCRAACAELRVGDAMLVRAFMPRRQAASALADRVVAQLRGEGARRRRVRSWATPLVAAAAGFLLAVLLFQPPMVPRPDAAQPKLPLARLALATGPTEMCTPPAGVWLICPDSGAIQAGAAVRTSEGARCEIEASDGTQIRLDAGTLIELPTPRCVKLTQGELYSSIPEPGMQFKVEMPDAVVDAGQGKFDVACSPGQASLTVIEGSASVECKSGTCRVGAGERVRLIDGRVKDIVAVADTLRATAWVNELLVLKGPENAELTERLNDILAQIGETKLSYLYEDEIRRLGSRATLPLLRYVESPRSQAHDAARVSAARIAADLADSTAIGDLIALLSDGDPRVRVHAARALERLAGNDQGRPAEAWQDNPLACQPTREAWQAWWQSRSAPSDNLPDNAGKAPSPQSYPLKARNVPGEQR